MPLMFDMPMEKLKTYQGRNPRPDDFDQYWERALAELKSTSSNYELKEAMFSVSCARCYHLYFTSLGGARIHAKLLLPVDKKERHPALLLFHGYRGNSGNWYDKLGYVSAGFVVAAMDCRGQGGLSEDPGGVRGTTLSGHIIRGLNDSPDKLMYRNIFLDTVQLARVVGSLPEVDHSYICASGMSQGGGLTIACAALEPSIKRAVVIMPFLSDYKRVWEMDQAKDAYVELRDFFRIFDPAHEHEDDIFIKLGYIDVQHLAPRIRAEVLMVVGLMDTVCPPSTQFAVYNKIKSSKHLLVYPDYAHEVPTELADRIFQFITSR